MRIAFSLDDQTHAEAVALARKLRISRSALCRAALREYLARHRDEEVMAALNRVYGAQVEPDDAVRVAARRTFEGSEW